MEVDAVTTSHFLGITRTTAHARHIQESNSIGREKPASKSKRHRLYV
jgi:hypothetical protein